MLALLKATNPSLHQESWETGGELIDLAFLNVVVVPIVVLIVNAAVYIIILIKSLNDTKHDIRIESRIFGFKIDISKHDKRQ